MLRFIKTYGSFAIGLLISFLSVLSTDKAPVCEEGKELTYLWQLFSYKLFVNRELIGWISIGCLVVGAIIVWISYRPQSKFMSEACSYVRKNISLSAENAIQVSIFTLQSGWRTLLTYFKNLFIALINPQYRKNGLLKIYAKCKFPNPLKQYYVRKEQSSTIHSFWKPTIYFQETYNGDEFNGFMSYYLANGDKNYVSTEPLTCFNSTKEKDNYNRNEKTRVQSYLNEMKLKYEDLRCFRRASNFLYIEPLVNRKGEYIGVIVVDIAHNAKIQTDNKNKEMNEFKQFMSRAVRMINIAENNIE